MQAYGIQAFGQPEVFQRMELNVPSLRPGHVFIRVKATSINPVDYKIRAGILPVLALHFQPFYIAMLQESLKPLGKA